VSLFARIRDLAESHKQDFANAYAEAGGDHVKAKRILRAKLRDSYGMDPATIFMLLQIAIRIYLWARDNGYLSKYDPVQVPMAGFLETMALEGDLDDE
jgi:hypothetical protein